MPTRPHDTFAISMRADNSAKITRINAEQFGLRTTVVHADVQTEYGTVEDTFTLERRPEGFVVISRNEGHTPSQAAAQPTQVAPPPYPSP